MKFSKYTGSFRVTPNGIPYHVTNLTHEVDTGSKFWYISYNCYSTDYGCPTTAIVLEDTFIILKGDHREAIDSIINAPDRPYYKPRLALTLQYVVEHASQIHPMSGFKF